jgi:hypothetical protein
MGLRLMRVAIIEAIEVLDEVVLGVDVELADLKISVWRGRVEVTQLVVDNPEGYNTDYLLDAQTIIVDVNMKTLLCTLGRHLVVEEIALQGVDIIYDKGLFTSHVADVLDHLNRKKNSAQSRQSRSYCSFGCLGDRGDEKDSDKLRPLLPRRVKEVAGKLKHNLKHNFNAKAQQFRGCCDKCLPSCTPKETTIKMVKIQNVGLKLAPHVLQGLGLRIKLGDVEIPDVSQELDGGMSTIAFVPTLAAFLLETLLKSAVSTSWGIVAESGEFINHSVSDLIHAADKAGLTYEGHESPPTTSKARDIQCC